MSEFNKYSTDGGATFIDVEDSNAVHWEDNGVFGVKNWLPPFDNFVATGTTGVTMTDNGDCTVTVNPGTVTSAGGYWLYKSNVKLKDLGFESVNYKMSMSGSNTSNTGSMTFTLRNLTKNIFHTLNLNFSTGEQTWTGDINIIDASEINDNFDIYLWTPLNTVISTAVIVSPMIRLASDTDTTFRSYAMTNRQITSALKGTIANPYIVPSDGDLNTIKVNGVYKWGNDYHPANSPSNKTNCYMFVFFNDSNLYTQIVFEGGWRNQDGHIYIRGTSDGGSNWSSWRKVSDSVLS